MAEAESQEPINNEEATQVKSQESEAQKPASSKYKWDEYLSLKEYKDFIKQQSVIYDEDQHIRVSPLVKDGKLLEYLYEDVRTLHDLFMRGLRLSNNGNCLGYRPGPKQPYKWFTYQEVLDRAQNFGSGLIAKGAETNPEQRIGIYSQNRVEWSLVDRACNAYSMVIVPLYDTLGPQAMKWIITQCELQYIVVDKCKKAVDLLNDEEISVKVIVMIEDISDEVRTKASEKGTEVISFTDMEELGKANKKDFLPPKPEDLHTICYTSGTTGNPKGVMITHKAFIADTSALYAAGKMGFLNIHPDDVHFSYLPLAHAFEKIVQAVCLMEGASIGFFQGDIKLLTDDVQALKPTIFPLVPRLMNKFYDKITASMSESKLKKFVCDLALRKKLALLEKGVVSRTTIWDKLVFKKAQNLLGGRIRICATGAAPVSPTVLNFMRCALGVPLTEGYGQTESCAAISTTIPGDYTGGNVGSILPGCFVKLVDVPEKNYFAKDGKGEVCVKGPIVFSGYFKNEEKTKETIDEDGWLHTGDVGMWLPNGALKIFDRSKHIFKLAQGEYIAPEKIEQIYVQSAPVGQVFVHGDSLKASLVVVVVPDAEAVVGWCKQHGINGSFEEICKNEEAGKKILEDMNAIGKKNGLYSFELAKKIYLSDELFSVENNLLTPTFKSRRPQLYERYKDAIAQMYDGLD